MTETTAQRSIEGTLSDDGTCLTISIVGVFDARSYKDFSTCFQQGRPDGRFVVDFGRTTLIDSSALGFLLMLRWHAGDDAADITFVNCNDYVRKILLHCQFQQLFKIP